jgi:hypothetical protein
MLDFQTLNHIECRNFSKGKMCRAWKPRPPALMEDLSIGCSCPGCASLWTNPLAEALPPLEVKFHFHPA